MSHKITMRQQVEKWMKKDNIPATEETVTHIFANTMVYYDQAKHNFYAAYLKAIINYKTEQYMNEHYDTSIGG